jgi:hypothetical protein
MIKSANQQYRESGSKLPFKEWLINEQNSGKLKDHYQMFSADGDNEVKTKPKKENKTTKEAVVDMGKWNMIGIVSVCVLVYGLFKVSKANSEASMELA